MLGFGYVKEEPVMAGDRYISKEPTYTTGNFFGSGTSPNGRFGFGTSACQRQNNAGQLLWTTPSGTCHHSQVDEDGNPTPAMVGRGGQAPNVTAGALCRRAPSPMTAPVLRSARTSQVSTPTTSLRKTTC